MCLTQAWQSNTCHRASPGLGQGPLLGPLELLGTNENSLLPGKHQTGSEHLDGGTWEGLLTQQESLEPSLKGRACVKGPGAQKLTQVCPLPGFPHG